MNPSGVGGGGGAAGGGGGGGAGPSVGAAVGASAGAQASPARAGVSLTPADVRKLMDAAMRMQRAGQTTHPKYAQIVALLRQYHHQRNGSATAGGGGGMTAGNVAAAAAAASQQRQRQLQLQQQLHQQQVAAGQAGRGVSTLQHQAQRLQQQQQAQRLQYQRQLQLQAQATAMASAPAPLDVAAHPFMQTKQAGSTQAQTPGQQLAAVQRNPVAQMLFSDKQLEYLHNQIRAYKALCHSMDEAMAQSKQSVTGSSSGGLAPASAPSPPPSRLGSAKDGHTSHEQPQQLMTKPLSMPPAPVVETADRKPRWTRASRNLLFLGPECFDGDLIDIAAKGHAAFGPYNLSSPWLGLSDVALKQRYLHALHEFLSSSLETLESHAEELSKEEARTLRDLRCVLLQQRLRTLASRSYSHRLALLGEPRAVDRKSFRRRRPESRVELYSEEKEKRKKSVAMEKKRRADHQLYLKAVLNHSREFFQFHKNVKMQVSRSAKGVKAFLDQKASKAEREEDRQEKLRLKALKANDMEAYGKLVAEAKNERLTYLLSQTNSYLESIRKLVREHKRKHHVVDEFTQDIVKREDEEGKDEEEEDLNYMEVASKGELPRQPMMLVGGDLKEYQLRGLQWMVSLYDNHLNGILADEMGLGKTIQSISLLTYVTEIKHNHGPFLVVVPLSTLSNWVNEFKKWAPDLVLVVYKGPPQVRKEIHRQEMASCQFNVLLTTYEYIMKDKHVLRKYEWQYIIVDEGHRMKNAQSKFAMTLGSLYTSRNRLLLTGTPLQNSLPELWALLNFLLPTIFQSVDTFEQWFSKPFSQFSQSAGTGESNELSDEERMLIINRLHQVLRPFLLRRVKSSVLDQLPDKVERVLKCELSGWQKIMYRRIQEGGALLMETTGDDGQRKGKTKYTSKGLSNVLMQLRKVCNHPYLFQTDGYRVDFDIVRSSGKFELLDRMLPKLKAAGHRVLMFSQMTQLMHVLEDYFAFRGFRYLRLDGSTSADEREQRMFTFNASDSPFFIFLLSTRAGGLGLNLATADTVVIFDSDWNPAMDAQAQDRAHRIGQKNEVRVFRLVTNSPVEEKILSRATDKMNMNNLVVEAGKFNNRSKEAERRAMLESLIRMEAEEAMAHGSAGSGAAGGGSMDEQAATGPNVLLDDEINEMMALTDGELALYQRMDVERKAREEKEWADYCKRVDGQPTGPTGTGPRSRLMTEKDAPAWLRDADSQMSLDVASGKAMERNSWQLDGVTGGASRKRKEISYRDQFTDTEFIKMCEVGVEEEEEAEAGVKGEATSVAVAASPRPSAGGKRGVKKRKREASTVLPPSTVDQEDERKAGEQDKEEEVEKDDDDDDDDEDKNDALDEETRREREVRAHFYRKILDGALRLTDTAGRSRADLFLERPSASEYPDYYSIVTRPMDLGTIRRRVDALRYATHGELEADVRLMAANAQLYNHPQSLVVADALEIERFVRAKLKRVRGKTDAQLAEEVEEAKQQHKKRARARKDKKRARHGG